MYFDGELLLVRVEESNWSFHQSSYFFEQLDQNIAESPLDSGYRHYLATVHTVDPVEYQVSEQVATLTDHCLLPSIRIAMKVLLVPVPPLMVMPRIDAELQKSLTCDETTVSVPRPEAVQELYPLFGRRLVNAHRPAGAGSSIDSSTAAF